MYVMKIDCTEVDPSQPDDKLFTAPERKMYKSAHAHLRWPVCHVIPTMAYEVSALSQNSREKTDSW